MNQYTEESVVNEVLTSYGYPRKARGAEGKEYIDDTIYNMLISDLTVLLQRRISPAYTKADARILIKARGFYPLSEKPKTPSQAPAPPRYPQVPSGISISPWVLLGVLGLVAAAIAFKD